MYFANNRERIRKDGGVSVWATAGPQYSGPAGSRWCQQERSAQAMTASLGSAVMPNVTGMDTQTR